MPDAPDKTSAPASDKQPVNIDMVGEELADNANIWHVYDRVAKGDDERRTKAWDNGLNNLALFAGLFSAVTTAFIIEARQDMEPDYAQLTFLVLNATAFGEKPVHQPFVIPSGARTVNCLWISSLILSLSAALIAIMGKDWIGMYTARPVCNLRQWAEMRTYRLRCVEGWYMSGVIAAAPVLLHVSLILFGAGLVLFISSDPLTHHLTLGLSLAAGGLYLVTTLSAVVFSASPFKSPATQMARAALSALYSYISAVFYWRKRNPIHALVRAMNTMFNGGTASLPGGAPGKVEWYAGPRDAVVREGKAALAYMRKIPAQARTVRNNLQWSQVRLWLSSMASSACRLSFNWFLSSTWTDLPVDRRPELLAEALSWLSGASQAPDVFRAVVFALGDLDVGLQVGEHTSPALRTRLRAEIRRTWQQVDFLTLSRYVLADRNTLGNPVLDFQQFFYRFDLSNDSALRCEDGIAAVIRVHPGIIDPDDLVQYSPDQVAQPRMHEFLLSHMQKPQPNLTDVLILLTNRYREHLYMPNSFNLGNLEAHLYQTLDTKAREAYATVVSVKYGGTPGAIELLTFLCCYGFIGGVTIPAAVELVMRLLLRHPIREHRCLAYLFGSSELWDATWNDKHWSFRSLYCLSRSLWMSCFQPCEPSSVRRLSDDWQFDLALARTAAMMLSPAHICYDTLTLIKFLHGRLCRSPSPSDPDNDEDLPVVRLVLEGAALVSIVGKPADLGYDGDVVSRGTAILNAIISHLARRLHDATSIDDEEQLFAALVHTEVNGQDDETFMWDLGEWLRTQAPEILRRTPSSTAAMRDVCEALSNIYPLCEHNPELRASWDRIGYSSADMAYLLDPYPDLGEFFARAEDPLARTGICTSVNAPIDSATWTSQSVYDSSESD